MTYDEFMDLYIKQEIKPLGLWERKGEKEYEWSEIFPYKYNGKFCFVKYTIYRYSGWNRSKFYGLRIKEFDTKEQANAYFKKFAEGYTKY